MCGIFRSGSAGSISTASPAIQPSPSARHLLQPALGHQLAADADAEERLAAPDHRLVQRLHHARHRVEPAPAIGERADARQHDPLRLGDGVRVGGDDNRVAGLPRRALEGLGGGVEITRAVIDDGDAHRSLTLRLREKPEDRLVARCRAVLRRIGRAHASPRVCRARSGCSAAACEEPRLRLGRCSGRNSTPTSLPAAVFERRAGGCCSPRARRAALPRMATTVRRHPRRKPSGPGDDQHEHDVPDERQPQPVPENPEHRHEEGRPGEPVLDEQEALRRASDSPAGACTE